MVMKVQEFEIAKEVIKSDGWWRFACGDVLAKDKKMILEQRCIHLSAANISNFHLFNFQKTQTLDSRVWWVGSKHWRMPKRKLNCHNFCRKSWLLADSQGRWWEMMEVRFSPFKLCLCFFHQLSAFKSTMYKGERLCVVNAIENDSK